MSSKVTNTEGKIKRTFRRRKMLIVEEEEVIAEDIFEETVGGELQEVIVHEIPSFQPIDVSFEKYEEVIDDIEERKELARIVGLSNVPAKVMSAFADIAGIFDEITKEKEIDTIKIVKSLRRRY